jgi:DNA primase
MNVEELLVKKDIYYIPKGSDLLVQCLNPEHDDKNPSCRIDKVTGVFHCFSCGFKGNIFSVFGIQRDYIGERAHKLLNLIQQIKISTRGVSVPAGSIPFSRNYRGISSETFSKFEAFTNDIEFPDRLVFPIKDITGRIVVLQGRHFYSNGKDKYHNFPSGVTLFPFPQRIENINNSIILVEGLFDMLNLHDKGMPNAVCCFGVSTLSDANMSSLSVFKYQGIQKIFVMFDGDEAGRRNSQALVDRIIKTSMFEAENIVLDDEVDPGDLTVADIQLLKRNMYE